MNTMCTFSGKVEEINSVKDAPKRIRCPECKRRFKPQLVPCSCGMRYACYIEVRVPTHKVKKWWKKSKKA